MGQVEITNPSHNSSLMQCLHTFTTRGEFTDLCFICSDKRRVFAHKLLLCTVSSELKTVSWIFLHFNKNMMFFILDSSIYSQMKSILLQLITLVKHFGDQWVHVIICNDNLLNNYCFCLLPNSHFQPYILFSDSTKNHLVKSLEFARDETLNVSAQK